MRWNPSPNLEVEVNVGNNERIDYDVQKEETELRVLMTLLVGSWNGKISTMRP